MTDMDRKAYEEKMDARLSKWEAQIQVLRARGEEAKADAKAEIGRELNELEKRAEATRERFRDLRASGEDAWRDIKVGLENSWRSMESGLKAARKRFD